MKNLLAKLKTNQCAIITVLYHLAFSGSMIGVIGSYITRIEKIEKDAIAQVDRAENMTKKAESIATDLSGKVKDLESSLEKVTNTCKKFKGF